jgi:amino acid adenylation domain-containing protein
VRRTTELSAAKQALLAKWLRVGTGAADAIAAQADRAAPLSFVQERQLFLELLDPGTAVNNLALAARLEGPLDRATLEWSANRVLARHEVLRTSFDLSRGRAACRVSAALAIELPLTDLRQHPDPAGEARRLADLEAGRPFDLEEAPLLRARVLRVAADVHVLTIVVHHTLADGWSLGILLRELFEHYRARRAGAPDPLPPLPFQYRDFAAWQRSVQHEPRLERQLRYWRDRLEGELPVLDLPADHPRGPRQSFRGATHRLRLTPALTAGLKALARRHDATLFMTLAAGLEVLLHRYCRQDDILLGTPIAGRTRPETQELIGAFINTLVLRVSLAGDPSFEEALARVREAALGAYAHQELPFERLVAELRPQRDLSRTPVFQVLFIFQNSPMPRLDVPGLAIELLPVDRGAAPFDLTLEAGETEAGLDLAFEYNADLFEPGSVARLARGFTLLLEAAAARPDTPISALPLMTGAERRHLVIELNRTREEYPDGGAHRLFEAQVARTPDATAVVCGDVRLSYRELDVRAERLAASLRARGIEPGARVGVCLDRTADLPAALLAVLKTGAAYLPLDSTLPAGRVRALVHDAGAALLITDRLRPDLPLPSLHPAEGPGTESVTPPPAPHDGSADIAYLIYTSGSTGGPKGVLVPHRALVNLLCSMHRRLEFGAGDRLLAVTSISFDIAALELFLPLTVGGTVVIATRAMALDPRALQDALAGHGITFMQATPSRWRMMLAGGWRGAPGLTLLSGGEPLTSELAEPLLACGDALWNLYGPTETTIWSSSGRVERGRPVTIGRPIGNTRFYLLDPRLRPVPPGAVGELCIGGDGLALGYLNLPELTAERFVASPPDLEPAGARLYRTGDLARYRPDGTLELLGRLDEQVKLHGFRIEPAEIEAYLRRHQDVRDAAVAVREGPGGDRQLVAYVVPSAERSPGAFELRRFLRAGLPAYLVPTAYVPLAALPLTTAGKLDRQALPPAEMPDGPAAPFTAARTPLEQVLGDICAAVLGVPRLGVHDNFFDLGGGSIQILEIVVRAQGRGVTLSPEWFFEHQTIAELASFLETHG